MEKKALGKLICPNGTYFVFYDDGTWKNMTEDGMFTIQTSDEFIRDCGTPSTSFDPATAWQPY